MRETMQSTCTWTVGKKHLLREFTSKTPQTKLIRIPPFARAPAIEIHFDNKAVRIYRKNSQTKTATKLCASLSGRNALRHFTAATLRENLQEKCCRPKPRRRLSVSLCVSILHKSHLTREFRSEMPQASLSIRIMRWPAYLQSEPLSVAWGKRW